MNRLTKIELGAAGMCLVALGSTAIASHYNSNDINVSIIGNHRTSHTDSYDSTEALEVDTNLATFSENKTNIEMLVSFKAIPDYELSTDNTLVFISDDPYLTINVPVDTKYPLNEEITVIGTISETEENIITLTNCDIIINSKYETSVPSEPESSQTTTTNQTTVPSTTNRSETQPSIASSVYVSASGKYHSKPNCSGMKNYTEMTLTQAENNGYDPCQKCYQIN